MAGIMDNAGTNRQRVKRGCWHSGRERRRERRRGCWGAWERVAGVAGCSPPLAAVTADDWAAGIHFEQRI